MLLCHRKSIIHNIIIVALIFISFKVNQEWRFTLRFISIFIAYYTLFMPWGRQEYSNEIGKGLEERLNRSLRGIKELDDKDWHDIVNLPAFAASVGSGILLSPSLIMGTASGTADIACFLVGAALTIFIQNRSFDGSFIKSKDKLIEEEVDRLYLKYKENPPKKMSIMHTVLIVIGVLLLAIPTAYKLVNIINKESIKKEECLRRQIEGDIEENLKEMGKYNDKAVRTMATIIINTHSYDMEEDYPMIKEEILDEMVTLLDSTSVAPENKNHD